MHFAQKSFCQSRTKMTAKQGGKANKTQRKQKDGNKNNGTKKPRDNKKTRRRGRKAWRKGKQERHRMMAMAFVALDML